MLVPNMANPIPRWRGFNLTEMQFAGGAEAFREEDFRWIAGWGFNFVRLPVSYTHWIRRGDPFAIDEAGFARVDQAIEFGERHGVHVSLCLHRAPGYCVNAERKEPFNLWRDAAAREAFCLHWRTMARRYEGIPGERLSFGLLNEPPRPLPWGGFNRRRHARVMRAAVAAIREIDSSRLLILDGLNYGRLPCLELADLPNVAQSCRAYDPLSVSHYRADWIRGAGRWPTPRWPSGRANLERVYAPWAEMIGRGVGVHCGEAGCHRHTPHAVFLAWFRDVLEVLKRHGIGWAMWNLRGPFGVLDSERADVNYTAWHGHWLDAELLALLRQG